MIQTSCEFTMSDETKSPESEATAANAGREAHSASVPGRAQTSVFT